MSLKVHRISSMNTSRKCICPLQMYMHIWLMGSRPLPGLCPWTPLGDFCGVGTEGLGDRSPPNPLCPPYLQTLATSLPLSVTISLSALKSVVKVNRARGGLGLHLGFSPPQPKWYKNAPFPGVITQKSFLGGQSPSLYLYPTGKKNTLCSAILYPIIRSPVTNYKRRNHLLLTSG